MCTSLFNTNCVDVDKLIDLKTKLEKRAYNEKLVKTENVHIGEKIQDVDEVHDVFQHDDNNVNIDKSLTLTSFGDLVSNAHNDTQSKTKIKQMLRSNDWPFMHRIRKHLWLYLLELKNIDGKAKNDYMDDLNNIFGQAREIQVDLPRFVDKHKHLNYYYLNSSGKQAVKRILCVYAHNYPDVTYSPLALSLCSLLLHYMQEHEVYASLCHIFSTKDHLFETKSSWETGCLVFVKLLKAYCRSSYDILFKYATDSLEIVLKDWSWWIFDQMKFENLVKIIDCYLFEGQKVLFRVGLSMVQQFAKNVKHEKLRVDKESIRQYCANSFESTDKLLKLSFGIRNLKRSVIRDLYKKETENKQLRCVVATDLHAAHAKTDDVNSPTHNRSDINVRQTNTSLLTHSQTINVTPLNYTWTTTNVDDKHTSIKSFLNIQSLRLLWNWIPERLTVYSPSLVFTSLEHGTSLNTLYSVLDNLEHCFIVIKTFENEVFGAFCSGLWSERKTQKAKYFGNGETFLFTLVPHVNIYKWVGANTDTRAISQELFIRANNVQIAIGGGGNDGLLIHGNLLDGSTNPCETFDNQPLSSVRHFQISIIEVISFS